MMVPRNHTQISPKIKHLHNKEVMEKESSSPEEADMFSCGTNRGPEEVSAEAQHRSQCSRSGARAVSPSLAQAPSSQGGPGEAEATSKLVWFKQRQDRRTTSLETSSEPSLQLFCAMKIRKILPKEPKGGTGTAPGGTSWFPPQSQSQHRAVSLSQAQNVQTTGGCHRAASSGPSHPPWIQDYFHGNYLENLLSKKKTKNSLNTQTLRS